MFLISTSDPWYGDLILYLQTQCFQPQATRDERRHIRHHAKYYIIVNDTLYHHGIDAILQRCLTHEEVELVLNDCHSGACGIHIFGMATSHKISRVGYFWPSIFKYCMDTMKKFPPCQFFQ